MQCNAVTYEGDTSALSYSAEELVGALQCFKMSDSGGVTR